MAGSYRRLSLVVASCAIGGGLGFRSLLLSATGLFAILSATSSGIASARATSLRMEREVLPVLAAVSSVNAEIFSAFFFGLPPFGFTASGCMVS
jgi:hypothetical protein